MATTADSNFSSEKARVLGKVDLSRKGKWMKLLLNLSVTSTHWKISTPPVLALDAVSYTHLTLPTIYSV